uniref:Sulfatase N-terminal domain-containing protein n=1 Tax=Megaselia scalaris TaxID=36166 RepID=T1GH89_MEGSC
MVASVIEVFAKVKRTSNLSSKFQMNRSTLAKLFLVFAVFSLKITPTPSKKLNVLFVMFDDFRPAISGYGDKLSKTPNLDWFMQKSFHFTNAYSQQSLCAPSRNSLLTGRRPDSTHLYDFYNYWRNFPEVGNFTTLPEYFKNHDYLTHSVGKIFHPGISSNFSDDFPYICPDGTGYLRKNLICPVKLKTQPMKTLPDIESAKEAVRFLSKPKEKPFFLSVGFFKPHIPFRFPKYFLNKFNKDDFKNYTQDIFKPLDMPHVAWNPYMDIRKRDDFKNLNISFPYGPVPEYQRISIRQAYYASVSYVDDLFGYIMKNVNFNDTIVLATSDHGWSLGEHAEWAKYSNFDVALKVPLIVYSPEFKLDSPKKVENIVELLDIFPTLADLAHLSPLKKCTRKAEKTCGEGNSLYSLLQSGNSKYAKNFALSQFPRPSEFPKRESDKPRLKHIKIMGYSIRTTYFRYTLWIKFNHKSFTKDWNYVYGEEMYDHRADKDEEHNLVGNRKISILELSLGES